MNIKLLIKKAMLNSHIDSQKALSIALGVSESYITKWKNDNSITDEYLSKLNALAGISEDNMPLHVSTIPLYPSLKASCSCGSVVCNCDNLESEPIQLPQEYIRECLGIHSTHGVHAIIADGESMEPTIKHGDIIFVSPCEAIKDGKVYIININDETYCKRVYKDLETGGLILRSDNPVAPEIKLSTSRILEMKIIGRVGVVLSRVVL